MQRFKFFLSALLALSHGAYGDDIRQYRLRQLSAENIDREQTSIETAMYDQAASTNDEHHFWNRHLGGSVSTSAAPNPPKGPPVPPTKKPTSSPTSSPTFSPTSSPTSAPTKSPTSTPTISPTFSPTKSPLPEKIYVLVVTDGSGDGDYTQGTVINIVADTPPDFKVFKEWEIVKGNPKIDNKKRPTTNLKMPGRDVVVRAIYEDKATDAPTSAPTPEVPFILVVTDGDGDGDYVQGIIVDIFADVAPDFKVFKEWVIVSGNPKINNKFNPIAELTMPGRNVVVRATYEDVPFSLTVRNGSGSGDYITGTVVTVTAENCPQGQEFNKWNILSGDPIIGNKKSSETSVTMSSGNAIIKASCKDIIYKLTVNNGSGSGDYAAETEVIIAADEEVGKVFSKWEIVSGFPVFSDQTSAETVLIMPAGDVVVRAVYTDILYTLVVTDGEGDGDYTGGTVVDIIADAPPDFKTFKEWIIIGGSPTIGDSLASTTELTMPSENVIVRAMYAELNDCKITDETRSNAIMEILKNVSGKKKFNKLDSPQSKAASWLIDEDKFFVCPGVLDKKLIQRYVMAVFYFSSEGDDWLECFSGDVNCGSNDNDFEGQQAYLSPVNECQWAGSKECNDDLCLVDITFEENNNLKGTMPTEFGKLETLEILSLESQEIGGTIPSTLADIPVLRIIDFDFNKLTGAIPESIFGIDTLQQLDLNDNFLTGTISNSIDNMVALTFIQLHFNDMKGTVPASMASLPEIKVAEFQNNDFSGIIPLCIGVQPKLIAISADCLDPNAKVTCGDGCGCECF